MLKYIVSFLLFFLFVISSVFAGEHMEDWSTFHKQGYAKEPEPIGQDSFYAAKTQMPTRFVDYFGFGIGTGIMELKPKISVFKSDGVLEGEIDDQKRTALYVLPSLYYGVGANYRNFYVAGEVSAFYNTLDKSVKQEITGGHKTEMEFRIPLMASLDILPGFINEERSFILYGRAGLGAGWVRFKLKDSFENLDEKVNRIKLSYRFGLGMEYLFTETFGMRVEYIYTRIKTDDIVKFTKSAAYRYVCGSGNMNIHTLNLGFSIY